jgi:hypothetical protein
MNSVIMGMNKIFQKMGKPLSIEVDSFFEKNQFINYMKKEGINVYFYKPYEHVKNQLVERVIKTFKELMLKYIYMYGWPRGGSEEMQVNKILDAVSWYYNHRFHHRIKAIPALVLLAPLFIANPRKNMKEHTLKIFIVFMILILMNYA